MIIQLKKELKKLENKEKINIYASFFKTGKGEYGQGDKFLGITVLQLRAVAKNYKNL